MTFRIDPRAERMPDDNARRTFDEVRPLLRGAQPVCEHIGESDMDRIMLTRGGQFLRQTGIDGKLYSVLPADEAYEIVSAYAQDAVIEQLSETLSQHGIEFAPAMRPGM